MSMWAKRLKRRRRGGRWQDMLPFGAPIPRQGETVEHYARRVEDMRDIEVWDMRPEVTPKKIAHFLRVPSQLTTKEIVKRYGIAEHLTVYRVEGDKREEIQRGRRH